MSNIVQYKLNKEIDKRKKKKPDINNNLSTIIYLNGNESISFNLHYL